MFAATYQGDHLSVRLLEKWVRKRRLEYLVEWKGRPEREFLREREKLLSAVKTLRSLKRAAARTKVNLIASKNSHHRRSSV